MATNKATKKAAKQLVLVRTFGAGVHCGTLDYQRGPEVKLMNARRIWSWSNGPNTCSELARFGHPGTARIATEVPWIILPDCMEIIPMTDEAWASLTPRWP